MARQKARKRKNIYSAIEGDKGVVRLEGHAMPHVLRCCPSEGWLEMAVADEDGRVVVTGDDIVAVRIHGRVEYLAGGV